MTGPTAALPSIDKCLLVAQALLAHDPESADDAFELQLEEQHAPPAPPGWRRYVLASGFTWHVLTSPDGSGRSRGELPPGVTPVATYRSFGRRPMSRWLAQRLGELERGTRDPGRPLRGDELARLRLALQALDDDFDAHWLDAWRRSRDPAGGWLDDLLDRHARLGASGCHVARLTLAAEVAERTAGEDRRAWEAFHDRRLTDARAVEWAVVRRAIDLGHVALLQGLLEGLREETARLVEGARAAPDRTGHLDRLHAALVPAVAADDLARLLVAAGPERVAEADLRRLRRIAGQTTELRTRLQDPFGVVLTDLEGGRWRAHVAAIAERPPQAREAAVRAMVEEALLYPRALAPALLGEPAAV